MKKVLSVLIILLCLNVKMPVLAQELKNDDSIAVNAESAILMEASTGTVIYEKNADEARPPASVTKIMTLLLIFEDLKKEKIALDDQVTISSYAASMGGSQVFLEAGEVQTVETLIKCICVSSANDGCVAMAEHLNGSETAFVERMNEKAKELGMQKTHFVNCCGLDADGHVTSARDIALMSRELTMKYPDIFQYSTIWMDEFVHKTAKGESVFGLSNTNKLLKEYQGCNGLKTGSTSKAKFCLSATATRNDISLIAVVMACPDSKTRTQEVSKMLDYGFANIFVYEDKRPLDGMIKTEITGGESKTVDIFCKDFFKTILLKTQEEGSITKQVRIANNLKAPIKKNEVIGEIDYMLNGEVIGTIQIYTKQAVKEKTYSFVLEGLWRQLLLDT